METEGGGWTVFLVQDNVFPIENFQRTLADYTVGFGDFAIEFWLGNELVSALTNDGQVHELMVNLEDREQRICTSRYGWFQLGNEAYLFRLYVSHYTGECGDSLGQHNQRPFSTFDADHDSFSWNCAEDKTVS